MAALSISPASAYRLTAVWSPAILSSFSQVSAVGRDALQDVTVPGTGDSENISKDVPEPVVSKAILSSAITTVECFVARGSYVLGDRNAGYAYLQYFLSQV